jgi:VIT1/CCC1 family predicted Fe2+/Mn2+ transporter
VGYRDGQHEEMTLVVATIVGALVFGIVFFGLSLLTGGQSTFAHMAVALLLGGGAAALVAGLHLPR